MLTGEQSHFSTPRALVIVLVLLTVSVRLTCLGLTFPGNQRVDYFEDVIIALNLLEGNGYSLDYSMRNFLYYELFLDGQLKDPLKTGTRLTALKTPGYPLLVAGVLGLFGQKNFLALFHVHVFIAALTCWFLFRLLVPYSKAVAAATSLIFAIYPPFVYHNVTSPESTSLTMLLIVIQLLILVRLAQGPGPGLDFWWMVEGAVFALLTLVDPATLPFSTVAIAWVLVVRSGSLAGFIRSASLCGVAACLMMAPWVTRNYLVFERFIPLKTPTGQNFLRGLKNAGVIIPQEALLKLEKPGRQLNEAQEDDGLKRLAIRLVGDNPMAMLKAMPRNFLHYWWETPRYAGDWSLRYLLGRKLPYILLLAVSLPSLFSSFAHLFRTAGRSLDMPAFQMMLLLIVVYTMIYTVFGSWNLRYHFPVELALVPFAAKQSNRWWHVAWLKLDRDSQRLSAGDPRRIKKCWLGPKWHWFS